MNKKSKLYDVDLVEIGSIETNDKALMGDLIYFDKTLYEVIRVVHQESDRNYIVHEYEQKPMYG